MTGKQFDMLKKLLTRQFDEVVDISDTIIKKINKDFNQINNRLDKLLKDREKNGFSWTKLLLFLSLFLIPVFWDKIIDLIKKIDKEFKIDQKIDRFIKSIKWEKIVKSCGGEIWNYIKTRFDKFIKNPMKTMINLVK